MTRKMWLESEQEVELIYDAQVYIKQKYIEKYFIVSSFRIYKSQFLLLL